MTRLFGWRACVWQGVAALLGLALAGPAARAERPAKPADALAAAKKRMRKDLKPGVVILVPGGGPARAHMAALLTGLFSGRPPAAPVAQAPLPNVAAVQGALPPPNGPDTSRPVVSPEAVEFLFCQAVFVCLPEAEARKAFPGLPQATAAVLLGLDGKPAATLPERPGLFQEGFVPAMTELLHGAKGERLAALAAAQRKALGVEMAARVDAAVKDLDNDRFRKREAASALLARSAKRTTAILLRAQQTAPSLEARRRLERLLEAVQNAAAGRPNRTLPYGARWEEVPRDGRPEGGKRFLRFGDKD